MVLIHDIVDTKSVTASLENISANFATVVELAPCRMVQQMTVLDRAEGFEENFDYPKQRILDGDGERCSIHTASCVAFCPVCDEPQMVRSSIPRLGHSACLGNNQINYQTLPLFVHSKPTTYANRGGEFHPKGLLISQPCCTKSSSKFFAL